MRSLPLMYMLMACCVVCLLCCGQPAQAGLPASAVATIGESLDNVATVFGSEVKPTQSGAQTVTHWFGVSQGVTVTFMRSPQAPMVSVVVVRFPRGSNWYTINKNLTTKYGPPITQAPAGKPRQSRWYAEGARMTLEAPGGVVQMTIDRAFLPQPSRYKLPEGTRILQAMKGDITGSALADRVLLVGRFDSDSRAAVDMRLLVQRGSAGRFSVHPMPQDLGRGYEASIMLRDVTGDRIPDVLYQSATGGSGGAMNAAVFTGPRGKYQWIFRSNGTPLPKLTGTLSGDTLTVTTPGQTPLRVPLSEVQRETADGETTTWGDEIVQWIEPVSRPVGIAITRSLRLGPNVNTVTSLRTVLKWTGKAWAPVQTTVIR